MRDVTLYVFITFSMENGKMSTALIAIVEREGTVFQNVSAPVNALSHS